VNSRLKNKSSKCPTKKTPKWLLVESLPLPGANSGGLDPIHHFKLALNSHGERGQPVWVFHNGRQSGNMPALA